MTQFNYEKIMQPNTVVHCKTEEQAENLLKWVDSKGLKWGSGDSYLNKTRYSTYGDETCYKLQNGNFAGYDFYAEKGYNILQYDQVVVDIGMETKCKNCGQEYGWHEAVDDRCPLIDFEGGMADGYWGTTFFEAEESEVDKLINALESLKQNPSIRYYFFQKKNINTEKLLEELRK